MPRASWLTTAEYSYAGSQYWIEALKDGPPFFSAPPNCWSSVWRLARVGACSEVTTWSNWTGSVPCWIGKVQLLGAVGASGRAGADVDEEVALEEDPRADRERRVLVDRQAVAVDAHRDVGGRALLVA